MTYIEFAEWKEIEPHTVKTLIARGIINTDAGKKDGKFVHQNAKIIIDQKAIAYENTTLVDEKDRYAKMIMDYLNATRY